MIFVTNNRHKLEEVSAILGDSIELKSLKEIGCTDDIPDWKRLNAKFPLVDFCLSRM